MKDILLVEDDPEISKLLSLHFDSSAYRLTTCTKAMEALDKVSQHAFDVIILDVMLPDISGLEVCKQLRSRQHNTPILMLTSLGEETDKVLALELGADDYVTKPFGVLELMARTKALLRRADHQKNAREESSNVISFNAFELDKDKRKASFNGRRLDLTAKEFDLLFLLAANPGKSFTRQDLLEKVWGFSFEGYEHTVTSHINRLRLKIEKDLNHPQYILTSWGIGYRFAE